MDEKLNSIDAKLNKLCSMLEDMKKQEVAILAKYPDRVAIYLQLRDPKLKPTLSPTLVGKHCIHHEHMQTNSLIRPTSIWHQSENHTKILAQVLSENFLPTNDGD